MTTLHEILYTIDTKQKVTVTVKYTALTADGITRQKMECFTGYPSGLMKCLDSGTLKHLARIAGVEDGVIQITSRPAAKLNKYKAYYTYAPVTGCKGANIDVVKCIEAVNLNDALRQAYEITSVETDTGIKQLNFAGINLIEGIG